MTCLLCGRRATHVAAFLPRRPGQFGGRRALLLRLCRRCIRKGRRHWTAAVEKKLANRAAAPEN